MFVITEEDRIADVKNKIKVIKKIIQNCDILSEKHVSLAHATVATKFLTEETIASINEIKQNPKSRDPKTLVANYEEIKRKVDESQLLSSHIHDVLYSYYVEKRSLFKLETLCKELNTTHVNEMLNVIKGRGYVWKKISGDKCILVEDPQMQAKRIKYLLDRKKFKELNKTFVYVQEKAIPADEESFNMFKNTVLSHEIPPVVGHSRSGIYNTVKVAASPQTGLVCFSFYKNSETFADWLMKKVTPHLNKSCVLVIEENTLKEAPINKPPKPEAKKEDMIEWLECNNIPHSNTMHRSELYALIDMFKDNVKLKYNKDFLCVDYEVLEIPKGFPQLSYFNSIWFNPHLWNPVFEDLDKALEKRLTIIFENTSLHSWKKIGNTIDLYETALFVKDMELEEVVDKLFTMAKDVDMSDAHLSRISEVNTKDIERYVNIVSGTFN